MEFLRILVFFKYGYDKALKFKWRVLKSHPSCFEEYGVEMNKLKDGRFLILYEGIS